MAGPDVNGNCNGSPGPAKKIRILELLQPGGSLVGWLGGWLAQMLTVIATGAWALLKDSNSLSFSSLGAPWLGGLRLVGSGLVTRKLACLVLALPHALRLDGVGGFGQSERVIAQRFDFHEGLTLFL